MRKFERILWTIVGMAIVLKLLHLPLASFLLIVGLSTIAILYWWFGWLLFPSPARKDQHIGLTILASFSLAFLLTGILCKVQAWPLASAQTSAGVVLAGSAVIWGLLHARRRPERQPYVKNINMRCAPLMVVALLLLPVSASSIMRFHHRGEPEQKLELYDRLYSTDNRAEQERIWQQLDSLEEAESRADFEQRH